MWFYQLKLTISVRSRIVTDVKSAEQFLLLTFVYNNSNNNRNSKK